MGAKDQYMAESIDWFLKNSLGKKIILVAHNAHIQKTPVDFDGFLGTIYGYKYKDKSFLKWSLVALSIGIASIIYTLILIKSM